MTRYTSIFCTFSKLHEIVYPTLIEHSRSKSCWEMSHPRTIYEKWNYLFHWSFVFSKSQLRLNPYPIQARIPFQWTRDLQINLWPGEWKTPHQTLISGLRLILWTFNFSMILQFTRYTIISKSRFTFTSYQKLEHWLSLRSTPIK